MLKLSIITINYNNAAGLEKTIRSVMAQTSGDFEYVVIDGASTDGSVEVIEKYKDKITYWISEHDEGIYNAMNKGILAAKGEYCQFLNSGDYLSDEWVTERMISHLDGEAILYGNMIKLWPNGKRYKNTSIKTDSMYNYYVGSLNHSPAYIRRSLFEKYGLYDEQLKIVSDWKFYLDAIALGNEAVKYVNIDVTCFDMTGISNTQTQLDKEERRKILEARLPGTVLNDYDDHWRDIDMMKRIKRSRFAYKMVWFLERLLYKWERYTKKSN
ncbi:MAG: glycosyltransferase family 2 protein [Bacteroidota bacterium]